MTRGKYMTNAKWRAKHMQYQVLEADGVTLAELAPNEDSAFMAAPKEGRTIQRDGVVRYVARDGGWVWAGVRTA